MPRIVPPTFKIPEKSDSLRVLKSPAMKPLYPSAIPNISADGIWLYTYFAKPLITALRPGQSPPAVRIPIFITTPKQFTKFIQLNGIYQNLLNCKNNVKSIGRLLSAIFSFMNVDTKELVLFIIAFSVISIDCVIEAV